MVDRCDSGRVLVFVVAYNARQHIRSVFERVPRDLFNDDRVDFLCIDDASSDEGLSVLTQWVRERGVENVTVLRNPVNQGYGGNQKLGYRMAVDGGYGFVILLHGDGQYAPELLPRFIETWRETKADVVLGSRMQDLRSAREGGMPIHKVIGNRLLSWFQNRLTGLGLSEYHTGYRGYSTSFLRQVPFEANTNEFHFDTQILLQAAHVAAKVVEFPIPTHYGEEVCHVPGLKYGRDVLMATIQFKMHQVGMLCSLKYRDRRTTRYRDKTQALYTTHAAALDVVRRRQPRTILDIGCGPGFVSRRCEEAGARVTGVDRSPPRAGMMSEFQRVDLEKDSLPLDPFGHDVVLLLDVIEHLQDPEQFLLDLRNRSNAIKTGDEAPLMLISTPNVAFAAIRLNLLLGRFSYAERGILDITHKRLFTRRTLRQTLVDCGYRVVSIRPVGVPFETVLRGRAGRGLGVISAVLARLWPTMFAFQFMVACRPLPGIRQILDQIEVHHIALKGPVGAVATEDAAASIAA
jgi:SAM-dependent methyltransferase